MRITGIVWLQEVVDKIEAKHQVGQGEVEDALRSKPRIHRMQRGRFRGEDVYRALGRTAPGRHLTVFFIHKQSGEALVLSARDMDRKERKQYARR
jgi:uncharacterized protein